MQPRLLLIYWTCALSLVGLACQVQDAPSKPKRLVVVFVDVTRSLVESERNVVIKKSSEILSNLTPGTEYRVYPIQIETSIVDPVAQGRVLAPKNALDPEPRRALQQLKKKVEESIAELYGKSAAGTDNQSCILNALPTAGEEFRRFRGRHRNRNVELDLVFVSDMIEECDRTPVGKIELDKKDISRETEAVTKFECDANLSDVIISVVIPATAGLDPAVLRDRRPDLTDRSKFWKKAFHSCDFPEKRFADPEWFNFSPGIPTRFQKGK